MVIALIIVALIFILGAIVTLYFTKKTFSRGPGVYDISIVLKDKPDLLERTQRGKDDLLSLPYENMSITSHDGLKLVGKLYRTEKDEGRYIICMHGYRSTPEDFMCAVKPFMSFGYNVLLVSQRTHGESEGKWITFGIKERYDCLSWCDHLIKTFGDDIKIVLDGLSMGASTVLMTAELDLPKNVIGIMADCGFTSPFDIVAHVAKNDMHIPKIPLVYLMIPAVRILAGFNLKAASTVTAVKKTKLPILYIHGLDDDFVPHEMSLRAYNARPENSTLVSVEGAKHGLSYIVDEKKCNEALRNFLTVTVNE